jgi:hypothetical protein
MLVFPQLPTGASAQYPFTRQLTQRSIRSAMEDGTNIALADSAADHLRWRIGFRDLSDQEASSLNTFFMSTQGNLLPFLFMDPAANLLTWSEDFSQSSWQTTGLSFDTAIADALGGKRAVRAHNDSVGSASIAQQTQIPGLAQTCFSVYLRSTVPATATLDRTCGTQSQTLVVAVTPVWQRFCLSGQFSAITDLSRFSVTMPATSAVELFGPQLDAQTNSSPYTLSTGRSGVFISARFDMKQMDVRSTGPNRNDCVVYVRANLSAGDIS